MKLCVVFIGKKTKEENKNKRKKKITHWASVFDQPLF